MSNKSEYICPICGADNMCTDFTDGFKWGRAYCNSCGCGGPEVRTGYDESLDVPWREEARKQIVDVVNEHLGKRGPQPDPITGLVPCGCGGKAMIHECHNLSYVIYCDKCKIETNYQLTADTAKDAWNTAMGYTAPPRPGAIGPDAGEMDPNGEGAGE